MKFKDLKRASGLQKALLIVTIISLIGTLVLTWDLVIRREVLREAVSWTGTLVEKYGGLGIVFNALIRGLLFLGFWIGWVLLSSEGESDRGHVFVRFSNSFFTLIFFAQNFLSLIHDLLFWFFRSTVLLSALENHLFLILLVAVSLVTAAWLEFWRE